MRLALPLIALLAACEEEPAFDALPVDQAAPPLNLTVSALNPGQPATFTATGAFPGQRIWFARSTQGPGAGPCPPALRGLCLDMLNPLTMGSAVANGAGEATFNVTLPPSAPLGLDVWFQALQFQAGTPYSSDVVQVEVGATCAEDAFEDNDTLATSTPAITGLLPNQRSCDGDDDWYRISVAAGERLEVDTFFQHAQGDLDLRITDAAGTWLANAASLTDNERAVYTSPTAQTLYIQVVMTNDLGGSVGNDYNLQIAKVPGAGTCLPDAFEPNDTAGTAAPVTTSLYSSLTACSRVQDDYYEITVPSGMTLDVRIFFTHAEGDMDLFLYDSSGGFLGQSSGTTDQEQVVWTAPGTTVVRIRTQLYTDTGTTPGNVYDMLVDL